MKDVTPLAFVKMTMIYCSRFEYWSVIIAREFRFSRSLYNCRSHLRRIDDSSTRSFPVIKSGPGRVYLPGCPPRPEALMHAIRMLQ